MGNKFTYCELQNKVQENCDAIAAFEDNDNQTLLIEGCDLSISGGNTVTLPLNPYVVYKLADGTLGVRNREWHDTKPVVPINQSSTAVGRNFRLTHDFSLPTTTDTVVNSLSLNDTDNTAQELDIQVLDTVITVPAGGIWVRYTGGSEGYWAIEVGLCCGPLELRDELGYIDRVDTAQTVGPVFLPEGQHNFRAWNIDSGGTNSSHTVRYSTDNVTYGAALPAGTTLTLDKREVECLTVDGCEEIPEGYSLCPPKPCTATVTDPVPETPIEIGTQKCIGPFLDSNARSSWWESWSPAFTANTGTQVGDWVQVGAAETSPDCLSDMTVFFDMGHIYHRVRRARLYHWIDWRVLVNGVAVATETYDQYRYIDHRTDDEIRAVPLDIESNKMSAIERYGVQAGSSIAVEIRQRWNANGVQSNAYVQFITGLRSQMHVMYSPREIVTDVTTN